MAPPYVDNANVTFISTSNISSLEKMTSVQYACNSGYFISEKNVSNIFNCINSSGWEPKPLPVCIKG